MNATCLFENSSTPYHGNRTKGTHKLYLCDGSHDNSLTATTQLEVCSPIVYVVQSKLCYIKFRWISDVRCL